MKISFYKYHGTGNDFIMIDNRALQCLDISTDQVKSMCDRRFGIGADGLILLRNKDGYDFEMVYYNADGNQSSMCGNGGRCIVAFAKYLGVIESTCNFLAIDGPHEARVSEDYVVELKMSDVSSVEKDGQDYVLNTGSPHYVKSVSDLDDFNVYEEGKSIRCSKKYSGEGINVNFVVEYGSYLEVATYERGVEDETYSCGTGVVACALSLGRSEDQPINIVTKGGKLSVSYKTQDEGFTDIWLKGPAVKVFEGTVEV